MPKRKLPPNDAVVRMYESGMSSGEIAEECGVQPITVLSLLARIGVPRRSAQEAAILRQEKGRGHPARYWLGKKQPREMVERRAASVTGEKHWLWKGGHSRRRYRGKVYKEKCDLCGSKLNLGIHHRDLDHYNNAPENLEVLCVSCHMSLHKQLYWDAIHAGKEPPKSNGPIGWERTEKGGATSGAK